MRGMHCTVRYCYGGCTDENDVDMLASSDYFLTAVSTIDEYEAGENQFTHTFASAGPFLVG